jgi:predicted transport protein
LVALQVSALNIGDNVALIFTKVLDQLQLGLGDDDIEEQAPASRSFWEERGSRDILTLVDEMVQLIKTIDPQLEPKYNKHFIGLARNGKPDNFVVFQPRKQWLRLGLALSQSDEASQMLETVKAEYDVRWRRYFLTLEPGDVQKNDATLREALKRAFDEWK